MRFNTPVFFQRRVPGEYNKSTGDYAPDVVTEDERHADVTNSTTATLRLVYGTIKEGSLTIRLQRPYKKPFDLIRIGEGEEAKLYCVDLSRPLRSKQVFVVSEVQGNGKN